LLRIFLAIGGDDVMIWGFARTLGECGKRDASKLSLGMDARNPVWQFLFYFFSKIGLDV
jgi:hypothetical protein